MKKLSKLSLLGEMDLLSKAELRKLVGAEPFPNSDCIGRSKASCNGTCYLAPEGLKGTCQWKGMYGQEHCRCLTRYAGE